MLTHDVRFEGWSVESWTRFFDLWRPRASPDREATRPRGGVIALHENGVLRKLLHTHTGRLDPRGPWPVSAPELAEQHHASWVLIAKTGALEEVMDRFGARLGREHDLIDQSLLLLEIVRELIGEGLISRWPSRLDGVPLPTRPMVLRALDSVCPQGQAMVLGLFREGELWTAAIARRGKAGFDVLAGPGEVRLLMGPLSGDWRRDYRHIEWAVSERYAPVAMGCFAEVDRFVALQTDPRPGAWGRAAMVRDVILSPMPSGVRLALGVDGARYAFETFRLFAGQSETIKRLEPWVAGARSRLGDAARSGEISSVLGFEPLAVLRALLRRD